MGIHQGKNVLNAGNLILYNGHEREYANEDWRNQGFT